MLYASFRVLHEAQHTPSQLGETPPMGPRPAPGGQGPLGQGSTGQWSSDVEDGLAPKKENPDVKQYCQLSYQQLAQEHGVHVTVGLDTSNTVSATEFQIVMGTLTFE